MIVYTNLVRRWIVACVLAGRRGSCQAKHLDNIVVPAFCNQLQNLGRWTFFNASEIERLQKVHSDSIDRFPNSSGAQARYQSHDMDDFWDIQLIVSRLPKLETGYKR